MKAFGSALAVLLASIWALLASVTPKQPQPPDARTRQPKKGPPSTDIYLASVRWKSGQLRVGAIKRVTHRKGYDNQPSFLPGGAGLLYTSMRGKQTDIFRYDLKSGKHRRLTQTPESEYSPTVAPGGRFISVVRVERDKSQRLWRFPLQGGKPGLVLPKIKPVGYHVWVHKGLLGLFVLGSPHTLQMVTSPGQVSIPLAGHIGRCLASIPGRRAISFLHRLTKGQWWLKSVDAKSYRVSLLTRFPANRGEDYAWAPNGALVRGFNNRLYVKRRITQATWKATAALKGLKDITRLAFSPNGRFLALVGKP